MLPEIRESSASSAHSNPRTWLARRGRLLILASASVIALTATFLVAIPSASAATLLSDDFQDGAALTTGPSQGEPGLSSPTDRRPTASPAPPANWPAPSPVRPAGRTTASRPGSSRSPSTDRPATSASAPARRATLRSTGWLCSTPAGPNCRRSTAARSLSSVASTAPSAPAPGTPPYASTSRAAASAATSTDHRSGRARTVRSALDGSPADLPRQRVVR